MSKSSFSRGSSRSDSPLDMLDIKTSHSDKFDPSKIIERSQSDISMLPKSTSQEQKKSVSYQVSSSSSSERVSRLQKEKSGKISESAKVYFDLSSDESFEFGQAKSSVNYKDRKLCKENSVDSLSQEEEISISRHSSSASLRSSQSLDSFASGSTCCEEIQEEVISFCNKYPLAMPISLSSDAVKSSQNMINLKSSYNRFTQEMEDNIQHLMSHKGKEGIDDIRRLRQTVVEAWHMPIYGRDLAYALCDVLRNEGVLDLIIENCQSTDPDILETSASLLEQCLSWENRKYVEKKALDSIVQMTFQQKNNHGMAYITTGILEGLFKISEEASTKIISHGGLDVILHWSKCSDLKTLRHCARAMSNLSLFGGAENQEEMARRNVPEWLFPLAFMEDDTVRYYACLAISVLVANKELEAAVMKSGTLDLVMPFITSTKPSTFAKSDISHQQGRDIIWLERLGTSLV
ncbi:hypothetical protein FSP39_021550 [Pinctada imbricata]|uniref:Sterile alpha and TIR motif-containing protein 1 n=1 Tax=Pinctada imbricata TaxID=66713 RepID=A0AA88XG75_PINIB|nr:hypothetical protein FSP39_021550 [Pinctada imbricata]